MISANLEEDPSDFLSTIDRKKWHPFLVRYFQDRKTIQYYEDDPAARDMITTVFQEAIRPTLLASPASTPRNEAVSTPLPSQNIAQEYENGPGITVQQTTHDRNSPSIHDQHGSCVPDSPRQGTSAIEQGVGNGRLQYQAYYGEADESEVEQPGGDPLPLTNLEDCLLAGVGDSIDDQIARRDSRPSRQATQSAASLISQQLNTRQYSPLKRKHISEGGEDADCTQVAASDAAEPEPGSPSPSHRFSDIGNHPSSPKSVGSPGCVPSTPVVILPSTPGVVSGSLGSLSTSRSPDEQIPVPDRDGQFADLDENLREKVQMIADRETLEDAWHVFNYMAAQLSSPAGCHDAVPDPGVTISSASPLDARLKELKKYIVQEEEKEKQLKTAASLAQLSKRVYLAELIGRYIEETEARRAEPRKKRRKMSRRLSVNDRFTDVLFPETIGWKNKQPSKEGEQNERERNPRKEAKATLKYWIQLGEPLARMAQRFGVGILLRLPKKLTDKVLCNIPRPQIESFLDYIDFLHPGLKEHTSNLSAILPSIVESGLPSQKTVLETYSSSRLVELYNRPFNELFEFCTGEDSQRTEAAGLRFDQMYAADNSRSPSLSVGMSDEDLSNGMADFCEYTYPSTPLGKLDDPQETGQLSDAHASESFNWQSGNSHVLAPLDFSDNEIPNLPSQFSPVLEQFDLCGRECFGASTEPRPSTAYGSEGTPQDNAGLSAQSVDMPQRMDRTNNDQGARTINPKDLLLYYFP